MFSTNRHFGARGISDNRRATSFLKKNELKKTTLKFLNYLLNFRKNALNDGSKGIKRSDMVMLQPEEKKVPIQINQHYNLSRKTEGNVAF